ncbi:PAS domain-containing protein, partial [Escherichia coli]|uniref:PAS domain-containing protein n=1 Tax=Escherichia coli TaxID=562 RepID=UPI00215A284C
MMHVHDALQFSRLEPYIERAFKGESVSFEFAERSLNGDERYLLRSDVPNRNAQGEVTGLFVLIRDVTERQRSAEALHQAYQ